MGKMRLDCVERFLARFFARYIRIVVLCPLPFVTIPILLTAVLSLGLSRHTKAFIKDNLDLYTPTDARARTELQQLDSLFHINDSDPFYASRRYDIKRAGYIIVTSEDDDGDVLNPIAMRAAMQLWGVIQSLTVEKGSSKLNYPSICVKFPMPQELSDALQPFLLSNKTNSDQVCVSNPLVELFKFVTLSDHSIFNKSLDELTLAQVADSFTLDSTGLSHMLGGVSFDGKRRINGAKAIMLPYALRHSTKEEDALAEKWEVKLVNFLLDFNSPLIRTSWWTYETLAAESARDREQLIRMLTPCFFAVSIYTVVLCCVRSWIRSRPLLAIGGVLNAAMAIISAVGLLLIGGFRMTSVAYSMPFIIFSVGVDNVFILLSAWRITDPAHSLEDRMSDAFGDAAVSITVTSLTDFVSFSVGCLTPFPSVQMFCVYAVIAVTFIYFYQMTFFAAVMVYTCRREVDGRHCLTFRRLIPSTKKQLERSGLPSHFPPPRYSPTRMTSCSEKRSYEREKSFRKNNAISKFFRTTYTDLLLSPYIRKLVLLGFFAYLVIAIYGCMHVKLGLEPNDLLPDNSYGKRTIKVTEKYFSDHGSFLHVWMYNLSRVHLGHRRLWTVLQKEIELYEYTEFTGVGDSWLSAFLEFAGRSEQPLTTTSFVPMLTNSFLTQPQYAKYKRDIRFNSNRTKLEASRVPIRLRYVGSSNQSRAMHLLRHLAETSEIPSGFAEQYNAVLPGTLSSVGIAGIAVVIVSLILIPEPIAAFWVSISIVSINVGILGFMTFWSVRLDFISMVTIVMSIGFCVDFAAHLAYNFSKGTNFTPHERVRNALYAVGFPILQSASSTILGVSFLASTESYVFRSFFKTIILVIVLGVLHGIVILPVLLTVFYCKTHKTKVVQSLPNLKPVSAPGSEFSMWPNRFVYPSNLDINPVYTDPFNNNIQQVNTQNHVKLLSLLPTLGRTPSNYLNDIQLASTHYRLSLASQALSINDRSMYTIMNRFEEEFP
ncbi:SSD domain-containing protein [Aphelenchoides besseyi]|nr:SSD domain-containing protein [Aphelenchoides besseyi]